MSVRRDPRQAGFDWRRPGLVAGVDEAGRGPLAGPVVAAAVILDASNPVDGLADSKVLAPARREELDALIRERCVAWGLGWADAAEIDSLDILQATMLAMRRALAALAVAPAHVIVDGNRCPDLRGIEFECTIEAVVKGDAHMRELDGLYPGYGFAEHKGYPTAAHVAALRRLGPSAVHRRSFGPVQSLDTL